MTISVNIAEAKAQLSYLIAQARAGEEVIICNRNEPSIRFVPVEPKPRKKRVFGLFKGQVHMSDDFFEPEYTEAELDEIMNWPLDPAERGHAAPPTA